MSYTTFLGDTFEDEHDEELTRKFGDTYKYFKREYPELYKLPTEDIQGIFSEFKKSPYGDTFEKSVDRTKQYINQHMPEWQRKYISPSKQLTENVQPVSHEIGNYTFQMTTPFAYAQLGTQNMFKESSQSVSPKKTTYKLGTLSGLMESNDGKKLWNNGKLDKTGGWSYGTYQIATKNGTMKDYLLHLQNNPSYQDYYNALQQAGGYEAASIGAEQFKNVWSNLSKDQNFLQSQQNYIINSKLNPTMKYVRDIKGWNLGKRSPVVRDVLYSTATQHGEGGAAHLLHNKFGYNTDISTLSDVEIINKIYDERANVDQYFRSSDPRMREAIKLRFINENAKALELLNSFP